MTRKFLLELGLSKELVDLILDEHGHTLETIKEKITTRKDSEIEKLESNIEKINLSNEKLKNINSELENKTKNNEWETKYKELETKYNSDVVTKDTDIQAKIKELETKETQLKSFESKVKKNSLRSLLAKDGVSEKLIKLVEDKFNLDEVEMDGDNVTNYDVISAPVKKEYPDIFANVEQAGFLPNEPNITNKDVVNANVYTVEQIKAMTPEEINKNWDNGVAKALEKGI